MTHDCIPEVTHPIADVSPEGTVFGFATSTIAGFATCTLHEAVAVRPSFVQVKVYVAMLAPAGGVATVVVAEPAGEVEATKPLPIAVPAEHAYEIERVIPTSATCGWHEIWAACCPSPPGVHCQLVTHAPL